jgi:hypothetical protein
MSYYGNDTLSYSLFDNSEKGRIKKYVDQFNLNNPSNQGMSMKELVDTTATIIRIRCQIKDLGSFEVLNYRDIWKKKIDAVLNPDKPQWEKYYNLISKGNKTYIDTIMTNYNEIRNEYVSIITKNNPDLETQLDTNERLLQSYFQKPDFIQKLRKSIDNQYFETTFTGTSIVAADGTRHLVNNLFSSLAFAIISIAVLMALLFRSWRMVLISMIPNLIPLVITGGIMGFFGVPLKPSTLLVFSIAFGISVDDTIHYLAKYRQELKSQKWNLKECVLIAIKESGLGMFYTSIVLYCGFSCTRRAPVFKGCQGGRSAAHNSSIWWKVGIARYRGMSSSYRSAERYLHARQHRMAGAIRIVIAPDVSRVGKRERFTPRSWTSSWASPGGCRHRPLPLHLPLPI